MLKYWKVILVIPIALMLAGCPAAPEIDSGGGTVIENNGGTVNVEDNDNKVNGNDNTVEANNETEIGGIPLNPGDVGTVGLTEASGGLAQECENRGGTLVNEDGATRCSNGRGGTIDLGE